MAEFFVDLSAATNGDGTAGSPYNTFTGLVFTSNLRVWVRRTTTPYVGGIALGALTNVEIIGWPVVGEYGYYERDPTLTAWDADTEEYWFAETAAGKAILDMGGASNCYVSRLNVTIKTGAADTAALHIGRYCTAYHSRVMSDNAYTTNGFVAHRSTGSKGVDLIYEQTTGVYSGCALMGPDSSHCCWELGMKLRIGAGVYAFDYKTLVHSFGNIKYPILNNIVNVSVTNNVGGPITQSTSLYSEGKHMTVGGICVVKVDQVPAATFTPVMHISTAFAPIAYIKAATVDLRIWDNGTYSLYKGVHHIKTDKLLNLKMQMNDCTVNPLNTVIDCSSLAISTGGWTDIAITGNIQPLGAAQVQTGSLVSIDSTGQWSAAAYSGEASLSTVARLGGSSYSIAVDNASTVTSPTVPTSAPPTYPQLKIGSRAAEALKVPVNAGLYQLSLYGADVGTPYWGLFNHRTALVTYCTATGPVGRLIMAENDDSLWTGIGTPSTWRYRFEIDSDDPVDVYLKFSYMDNYTLDRTSFFDPIPTLENLEV